MATESFDQFLNTARISQLSTAHGAPQFGKPSRPIGDPVAAPKPFPRFIPPPAAHPANLNLALNVVLPHEAKAAEDAGVLVLQAVGDTGGIHGDDVQKAVAAAMEAQRASAPGDKRQPSAFLYNLGDVVYFNGFSHLYMSQFYEPYQDYHTAIFAIAGNHDGDNQTRPGDPVDTEPSLFGFMRNFCDSSSHHASAYRATMTQPYVYWTLEAPFLTIVGLYSNVDGSLDARGTNQQQQWLTNQMAAASKDECLILAVHHPPYSLDTTHRGYPEIEVAIDTAIKATGRIPDAVLSGHVHSYQHFERLLGKKSVPYLIAGAGGYANTQTLMHKIETNANGKPLPKDFQTTHPDLKLTTFNDVAPGFLRVTVEGKKRKLTLEYFLVPFAGTPGTKPFDSTVVNW